MSEIEFKPVSGRVWTLPALFRMAATDRDSLPAQLQIGGRVVVASGDWFLTSAEFILKIPVLENVRADDLVVLKIRANDIEWKNPAVLKSVLEATVHVRPMRGYEPMRWSGPRQEAWTKFLSTTRSFFLDQGFHEATTPIFVTNPGMEPELEPFATTWRRGPHGESYFVPTSPELHLKQLLVHGFGEIFEIKTVARNEELTEVHEPEFQILEWYRAFSNLETIEADLIRFIDALAARGLAKNWRKPERVSIAELFRSLVQFDLRPDTEKAELLQLCRKLALEVSADQSWNDVFHTLFVTHIEPKIPRVPVVVYDYPPSQSALARRNARGFADRFELYWEGVELANAFHELNDPKEQRARFLHDQKTRIEYGRTPLDLDENFLAALEMGLPPSGGIAVGLDRLFMVGQGLKHLADAKAFPFGFVRKGRRT